MVNSRSYLDKVSSTTNQEQFQLEYCQLLVWAPTSFQSRLDFPKDKKKKKHIKKIRKRKKKEIMKELKKKANQKGLFGSLF